MTPDRAKFKSDQQKIAKTLKSNRAALKSVRQKSGEYSKALTSSSAVKRDLRKAGYLK